MRGPWGAGIRSYRFQRNTTFRKSELREQARMPALPGLCRHGCAPNLCAASASGNFDPVETQQFVFFALRRYHFEHNVVELSVAPIEG